MRPTARIAVVVVSVSLCVAANTLIDYSDGHEVNGAKVPFTETQTRPDASVSERFTNVQFNVPVDEKVFANPATQPTASGGSGSTR